MCLRMPSYATLHAACQSTLQYVAAHGGTLTSLTNFFSSILADHSSSVSSASRSLNTSCHAVVDRPSAAVAELGPMEYSI